MSKGINGISESAAPLAEARSLRGQALSEDSTGALSPIRPADDITVRLDNLAQSLAGEYPPHTLMDLAEAASLITRLRKDKAKSQRPDDIPEDVWDYVLFQVMPADLIGSHLGRIVHLGACHAILAERKRCARAAFRAAQYVNATADDIAAAVNNPPPPSTPR